MDILTEQVEQIDSRMDYYIRHVDCPAENYY